MALGLLYKPVSGGSSGPARRSGIPLEQPPNQHTLPNGCRESRKDTPCPAMYGRLLMDYRRGVGAAGIWSGLLRRNRA
jgi:hypothetical protein